MTKAELAMRYLASHEKDLASNHERSLRCAVRVGECIERRATGPNGYTLFHVYAGDGTVHGTILAHRFAYFVANGLFDQALRICHTCDNRKCVNPAHLFAGTQRENIQDSIAKGRFKNPVMEKRVLTAEQAISAFHDPRSYSKIGRDLGIAATSVWAIKHGISWSHVTGIPKQRRGDKSPTTSSMRPSERSRKQSSTSAPAA